MNIVYQNNAAVGGKPKHIFINRFNKSIDILGFQILLDSVKTVYRFDDTLKSIYRNQVAFECESTSQKNCIKNALNEYSSALFISFKSKSACYDFMNLLFEIKECLDKR